MTVKMTEIGEKVAVVEPPTYVITPTATEASRKGIQKKHVLIGCGLLLLAGLIIAGILIGMHIYAEQQKEIVKITLEFKSTSDGKNVKQDVTSDPNDNSVMYHTVKDGKDIYIVNDFNRDLQIVKFEFENHINCFVAPLNRTAAQNPADVPLLDKDAQPNDKSKSESMVFVVSDNPVSDRSFLPKKAVDMCKDVSVYWAFRTCNGKDVEAPKTNTTGVDRTRRSVYSAGYYGSWPCLNGCCWTYCSCAVRIVETYIGNGVYQCYYYTGTYCGYVRYLQATPGFYC